MVLGERIIVIVIKNKKMDKQFLFVGEERSPTAIEKNWTWKSAMSLMTHER